MISLSARYRVVLILLAVAAALALYNTVKYRASVRDWSGQIGKSVSDVFIKYGLVDDNLVRKTVEERSEGRVRYISTRLEYMVGPGFDWSGFDTDIKSSLRKTAFRMTKSDKESRGGASEYSVVFSRGKLEVFSLRITERAKAAPPVKEKAQLPKKEYPPPARTETRVEARVAIVMDDFGYSTRNLEAIFAINEPITFSVLPNQRYSREIAQTARLRGYEVIVHLPLEAHNKEIGEEAGTIKSGMSRSSVIAQLKKDIESVPGASGLSNHTGSKATEDEKLMSVILEHLKARHMYFFDSLTTDKSVCYDVASQKKLKFAERDIFLDNSSDMGYIKAQLDELKRMAIKKGKAIAICHDRKNTVEALASVMPEMKKDGIKFVCLSELVNR